MSSIMNNKLRGFVIILKSKTNGRVKHLNVDTLAQFLQDVLNFFGAKYKGIQGKEESVKGQ